MIERDRQTDRQIDRHPVMKSHTDTLLGIRVNNNAHRHYMFSFFLFQEKLSSRTYLLPGPELPDNRGKPCLWGKRIYAPNTADSHFDSGAVRKKYRYIPDYRYIKNMNLKHLVMAGIWNWYHNCVILVVYSNIIIMVCGQRRV